MAIIALSVPQSLISYCSRTAPSPQPPRRPTQAAHARRLPKICASVKDVGRLDLLERVYGGERTFAGELYVRALPGPLQYLPAFLLPGTLALSAIGAAFGPGVLEAVGSYLPAHQVSICRLRVDSTSKPSQQNLWKRAPRTFACKASLHVDIFLTICKERTHVVGIGDEPLQRIAGHLRCYLFQFPTAYYIIKACNDHAASY